jgi:hypothetical protein
MTKEDLTLSPGSAGIRGRISFAHLKVGFDIDVRALL